MNAERKARLIRLARVRGDKLALAVLEADRPEYRPEPDYPMLGGLRWAAPGLRVEKARAA